MESLIVTFSRLVEPTPQTNVFLTPYSSNLENTQVTHVLHNRRQRWLLFIYDAAKSKIFYPNYISWK